MRTSTACTLACFLALTGCVAGPADPSAESVEDVGTHAETLRARDGYDDFDPEPDPDLPPQPPPQMPPYEPDPSDPRACPEDVYEALWDRSHGELQMPSCNLRLPSTFRTTNRIRIRGDRSNITIECNGAMLDGGPGRPHEGRDMISIESVRRSDGTWARPENIRIEGCDIRGSVRVFGMAPNGNDPTSGTRHLYESSHAGYAHTTRARNAAPRRITFDGVTITPVGRNPFYLAPGVTEVTLENSEIGGTGSAVAIYLDAESAYNTIRNNYIHMHSRGNRELIAVDGSSHNRIVSNYFSGLEDGGIYLYRNCGEGGTVRVATPSDNYIVNNTFYYDRYTGDSPAIYLGSRDGDPPGFEVGDWWSYCDDDDGAGYGSSWSDHDYARRNTVMQNQIVKRSVGDMIRSRDRYSRFRTNYVGLNTSVTTAVSRQAGCFTPALSPYVPADRDDFAGDFLQHGETGSAPTGECPSGRWRCTDGALACTLVVFDFPQRGVFSRR